MSQSLRADKLDSATAERLMDSHTDVTGAHHVQVVVDEAKHVLHVNVNGVCLLRVCRIEQPIEVDDRDPVSDAALFRRLASHHWTEMHTIVGVLGRDVQLGVQTYTGDHLRTTLSNEIRRTDPDNDMRIATDNVFREDIR